MLLLKSNQASLSCTSLIRQLCCSAALLQLKLPWLLCCFGPANLETTHPTVPLLVQVHVLDAAAVFHLKLPCPLPLSWGRQVKPYDPACAWRRVMQQSPNSTPAQAPEHTAAEWQAPDGRKTPRIPCKLGTGLLLQSSMPSSAGCPTPGHCSTVAVSAACPGSGSAAAVHAACPEPGSAAACADSEQLPAAVALACSGQTQAAAADSQVHPSASSYDTSAAPGGCQPAQSQLTPARDAEDKRTRLLRVAALTADVLRGLGTFMAVLISAGAAPFCC